MGFVSLVDKLKMFDELDPEDKTTKVDSPKEALRQFLWGSPKFVATLGLLEKILFEGPSSHRKVILNFNYPRTAEMFYLMLKSMGVRCSMLTSDHSGDERYRILEEQFNVNDDP